MLLNPKLKVAEIAEYLGYQDIRHFAQMFRKKYNVTPNEYRQQQNINILLASGGTKE